MNSRFDAYEFLAVIPSGLVLLLGLYFIVAGAPHDLEALGTTLKGLNTSVGDLGLILILAFVAGQLVRALTRVWDRAAWKQLGGLPTDRMLDAKTTRLDPAQYGRLIAALHKHAILSAQQSEIPKNERSIVTREIYAFLSKDKHTDRVDAFNRTGGLFTGLVTAFVILAVASLKVVWGTDPALLLIPAALLLLAALSGYGAYESGLDYGREMVTQFLALA